jgi:hypothetical protein
VNQMAMGYLALQKLGRYVSLLFYFTADMIAEGHRILAIIVWTEVFDSSLSFSWKSVKIKILKCTSHRIHINLRNYFWCVLNYTH